MGRAPALFEARMNHRPSFVFQRRKVKDFLWFFFLFLILVFPASVLAHGDHGDAASLESGGPALVAVGPYEIEFLARPAPPLTNQDNKIVAKVLHAGTGTGAAAGKVLIKVEAFAPPEAHAGSSHTLSGARSLELSEYQAAPEEVWAGSYTVTHRFSRAGLHKMSVAIVEMGGRAFDEPFRAEFIFRVASSGLSLAVLFLFGLAAAIAATGTYAIWVKGRTTPMEAAPFNFLDVNWIKRLFKWRYLQPAFQIPLLAAFVLVVLLGFIDIQDGGKNLATKLTWTIWWAGIIFTFLLVGRLWCLMCPFGALNEWASRAVKPKRRFPRTLRNLWLANLMFILLTWADEQLGVVRSPAVTSWLVIFFAATAIVTGLFYLRRSFCRHLCPIGGLISIYSMTSPLELRAESQQRCKACRTKDCYQGNEQGHGCPMFEFPQIMDRNNYCNLCGECIKTCPEDNITLRLRPFSADIWATKKRQLDEAYLAAALVGITAFVTVVMLKSWLGWMVTLGKLIPINFIAFMKPVTFLSLTESAVFFFGSLVGVPALILAMAAWANRLAGPEKAKGVMPTFVTFSYMFIPIGLAMHLSHNVMHLMLEGTRIVPVIQRTALEFTPLNLGLPNWDIGPLLPPVVVYWIQMSFLILFFAFSIYVGYRLALYLYGEARVACRVLTPMVALVFLFTLANIYLLNSPMGARHG